MSRRQRYRQLLSHLDLKSSDNLEWVLDHLEALDDYTQMQVKLRLKKQKVVLNG